MTMLENKALKYGTSKNLFRISLEVNVLKVALVVKILVRVWKNVTL